MPSAIFKFNNPSNNSEKFTPVFKKNIGNELAVHLLLIYLLGLSVASLNIAVDLFVGMYR